MAGRTLHLISTTAFGSVPDERKRLKWFAEASGLCKRKHGPMDLRKFVDLYGEKWKIKDCELARTLAQKPQPLPESPISGTVGDEKVEGEVEIPNLSDEFSAEEVDVRVFCMN